MSRTHYTHSRGQMKIELHSDARRASAGRLSPCRIAAVVIGAGVLIGATMTGCQADGRFENVPESICTSGEIWAFLDKDSPLMNPGRSCVQCHAETNDPTHAPLYTLAGTVMEAADEENDCRGAEGLTVTITDAAGVEWAMLVNSAGNFWLDPDVVIAMPYTARVTDAAGNVSVKQTPVNDGDCAGCHTPDLGAGFPGRIVRPGAPLPTAVP